MKARVLITRTPARAAPLVAILKARDIKTLVLPVTSTEPSSPPPPLPDLETFRWIAFTSVNGVEAFAETLEREGGSPPEHLRIAAVGKATANAVAQRLRRPALEVGKAGGAALAEKILVEPDGEGGTVVWPCAATARADFSERLTEAGIGVLPWPCYETRAIPAAILSARLEALAPWHVAVFAAPSAVSAFAAAWPLPWSFRAVAIGATTAQALEHTGVPDTITSAGTSPEHLAEAVVEALRLNC